MTEGRIALIGLAAIFGGTGLLVAATEPRDNAIHVRDLRVYFCMKMAPGWTDQQFENCWSRLGGEMACSRQKDALSCSGRLSGAAFYQHMEWRMRDR